MIKIEIILRCINYVSKKKKIFSHICQTLLGFRILWVVNQLLLFFMLWLLEIQFISFQAKNDLANAKLKQMVRDQQEAEKQKSHSQEIQKLLEIQKIEIAAKSEEVKTDLDQVEPAVIEAQQAVKCIRKQHLVEVRSMGAPPAIIR